MFTELCIKIKTILEILKNQNFINDDNLNVDHIQWLYLLLKNSNYCIEKDKYYIKEEKYKLCKKNYLQLFSTNVYDDLEELQIIIKDENNFFIDFHKIYDKEFLGRLVSSYIEYCVENNVSEVEIIRAISITCPKNYVKYLTEKTKSVLSKECKNYILTSTFSNIKNKEQIFNSLYIRQNKDYALKELKEINFDTPKAIYTSVFVKKYSSLDLLYINDTDNVEMAISCLIECLDYYSNDLKKEIEDLLDYSYKNTPVIFYLCLNIFKHNRPDLLPLFFSDPNYGAVFLMLLDDFFNDNIYQVNNTIIELEQIKSITNSCFDYFIKNLSQLIPLKGQYNKAEAISFIIANLVHKARFATPQNNYYRSRVNEIFNKFVKAFTNTRIPIHYDFIPIAEESLNYDLHFLCTKSKIQYYLLNFNYLYEINYKKTELCKEYAQKVLDNLYKYLSENDYPEKVDYLNFNPLLNYNIKYHLLHKYDLEKLNPKSKLIIIDIFYKFYSSYKYAFNSYYKDFIYQYLKNCLYKQSPEKLFNCFDDSYDKNFEYLQKALTIIETILNNKQETTSFFKDVIHDIPYMQRFYIYNNTEKSMLKEYIKEHLINISITEIEDETFNIDEYYRTIVIIYNSKINNELARQMLDSFMSTLISDDNFFHKQYQHAIENLYFFDALLNKNLKALDEVNRKYNNHQDIYLFYRYILLSENGELEKGIQLLEELIKKEPDNLEYKLHYNMSLVEINQEVSLDECDELIQKAIELQGKKLIILSLQLKCLVLYKNEFYEDLLSLFMQYKIEFLNYNICPEEIILTLSKLNEKKLITEFLSYNNNIIEYSAFLQNNNIQLDSKAIRQSLLMYLTFPDEDKFKLLPDKINKHYNEIKIFFDNILYSALYQLANKCNSCHKLYKLKENAINDFLQSLLDLQFKTLDFPGMEDQPRIGQSNTNQTTIESDAGNADLVIMFNKKKYLIEALWLDSINTKYLDAHIDKVNGYAIEKEFIFNVIYYRGKNYSDFISSFKSHIDEHVFSLDNKKPIKTELIDDNGTIARIKSYHTRTEMFYYIVDFKVSEDKSS